MNTNTILNKYINLQNNLFFMADKKPINNSHIANIVVENYSLKETLNEATGDKSFILEGLALPFEEYSRNGVFYRTESIKKNHKTMEGVPFLFNHNTEDYPKGKVVGSGLNDEGMTYKVDIDPAEEQLIRKLARKEIKNVSIQCMVENPKFHEDGRAEVDVKEFLELSAVTVAGFKNTTANMLAESFGKSKMVKKEEKLNPVKTESEGEDQEVTLEDLKAEIEAQKTKNAELEDRLAVVESRLDAEEENEESADEEETPEENSDEEETEEESTDEDETETEESDEDEEDKPKEKLKRKAIPTSAEGKRSNTIDMRAKRLQSMGY